MDVLVVLFKGKDYTTAKHLTIRRDELDFGPPLTAGDDTTNILDLVYSKRVATRDTGAAALGKIALLKLPFKVRTFLPPRHVDGLLDQIIDYLSGDNCHEAPPKSAWNTLKISW